MEELFICPRCGNRDLRYVGTKNGKPYCRKCIVFNGAMAPTDTPTPKTVRLSLSYSLSKEQKTLSDQVIANFKEGIDTLVYAVCGSGKTEISYGVIAYAMSKGMRVGFALPRRDVVTELYHRLASAFPNNSVVAVYGQHVAQLTGDCLILTTHQLFRYPGYFDLLVLDEIDAFPFKGDETLNAFFRNSLKGHCVMMTATPSPAIVREFRKPGHDILCLRTRFHRKPIPVPASVLLPTPIQFLRLVSLLRRYSKEKKQCLVFAPSVAKAGQLYRLLSFFVPRGNYVSSKRGERSEIITAFKKGKYAYLVTTAVLERGVTIRDLQVVVYGADDRIYDAASLIQIAGRAGRKADAPYGEVSFLAKRETKGMKDAIKEIAYCNTFLQNMRQKH